MQDQPRLDDKKSSLRKELDTEIERRRKWNTGDYKRAQWIAWASILASAITTIATAHGIDNDILKIAFAAIATIPGLMVAVESSFKYAVRSRMNGEAMYDLLVLKSKLDQENDPYKIEQEYAAYMKRLENDFPSTIVLPALPGGRT